MGASNLRDGGFDDRGVDHGRLIARETEEYGAVGGVAEAGERERAVERSLNAGNTVE